MGDQLRSRRLAVLADEIEEALREGHPRVALAITPATTVDVRRAARAAGDRLGWRVSTHVIGPQLLVVDRRAPSHEVQPWIDEMFSRARAVLSRP